MKKLVKYRKYFLFWGIALSLIMLCTFIIFGNPKAKILLSVLTIALPFVIYGFIRLLFYIISRKAPQKAMLVFSYFFIIGCTLGLVLSIIPYFIMQFPNGYSPSVTCLFATVLGVVDYNSKI